MATTGIILAGGLARRLGGVEKALIKVADAPLLQHVLTRVQPQCDALALSANGDPSRFSAYGLEVLADPLPDHQGPLAGVLAGLDWAAGRGAEQLATVPVDTPFLPSDLVARLEGAAGPKGAAIAASMVNGASRAQPVVGLWPVSFRDELREILSGGQRRVLAAAKAAGAVEVLFEREDYNVDPFFNINTPEDVAKAERLATR
ncbi:molybdenum cofactor guanylyltransferase MobA [Celeribacter sp.]|uniref:molybdenum cofactor guanylyltransferase MobA n=1 Tax=Celeribacter sp. TaxID=1890673 RepID=UPI003A8FAAB1